MFASYAPLSQPVHRSRLRLDRLSNAIASLLSLACFAIILVTMPAQAKTPGTVHCYGGLCHRVNSIDEMDGMVGRRGTLVASYYDDCRRDRFNPCGLTSSGAVFEPDRPDNAASPIFPDGTVLLTYNSATRQAAVVRVTSTGPYRGDRKLDVSRATAEHLGFIKKGVAELEISVLQSPNEVDARYRRMRVYPAVPGHIGSYDTFEAAHDAAIAKLRMESEMASLIPDVPRTILERWMPNGAAKLLVNVPPPYTVSVAVTGELIEDDGADVAATATSHDQIIATTLSESSLVAASDRFAGASIFDRVQAFIVSARVQAHINPSSKTWQHIEVTSDLPFAEKARSFVRAAQVKARLGANDQPLFAGLLADFANKAERMRSKD